MSQNIESLQKEDRIFRPSEAFSAKSHVKSLEEYEAIYKRSIENPEGWWSEQASELTWQKPWDTVLDWSDAPFAKWFDGGKLNAAENCLDRHVAAGNGEKVAIHWVGEPGDIRDLTFSDLLAETCRFANALKSRGVKVGDRVLIYMPMIPEAAVAMLACARIGAVHSVVFGGFSASSIRDRLEDSEATVIITADGGWRRGGVVPLKTNVDEAMQSYDKVDTVFVVKRCENEVTMKPGRDLWWHDATTGESDSCPAEGFDAEHPLFILYTSGSTGKPKGILHTTGGYLTGTASTFKYIFDYQSNDIYWCTADVGWITGHSYIVYGPMANGATQIMYEGAPNFPDWDRFWQIISDYKVTIFYTAPTAIRAFIKSGDHHVEKHDLSSLRVLGTVGEPINPEAWMWYHEKIGGGRCPIVDTWWQTETGAIMISPLPGAIPTTPGTATRPFFGIDAAILDETGGECGPNEGGKLVIRKPWPSMLRTIYKDPERYKETYWNEYEGIYLAGDGARTDENGYFWIVGRLDDVLNVSGHRLGTAEVESALVSHPAVAEAAVVGRPHDIKGQAIVAFVTLKEGIEPGDDLAKELRNHVGHEIGAIAKPDDIRFAQTLPKTRSGKIMRRLLKEIVAGGEVKGDTSALEDLGVVASLQKED
ncbi:MAG: acetate--CoA ligase [Verrucomicrobiales bacterium]|jgi:acetyl-CoA synthetase|nr:acetate--CoA ligase [Verrucomicrobiales bacterium]MBP9224309.1 acetate--CoA ligase [Verrucomicrobiales bacterium]